MRNLFSLIFILILFCGSSSAKHPILSNLYHQLDSLISEKENFENDKEIKIINLKNRLNTASTTTEKILANDLLFDEYSCYNADSAAKYVDESIRLALQINDPDLITSLKIKKSFLLAATGLLDEARDILSGINTSHLPHELKKDYLGQMIYIYGLLGNYASISSKSNGWNRYFEIEQTYKDSLQAILKPGDSGYLWYLGWSAQGMPKHSQDSVMNLLKKNIDNSKFDSREVAQMAYVLAILYKEQGDTDKYLEYLSKSAITDVKIGNREIASLQELAKFIFDRDHDIDRAYNYITYSLDAALNYPNRVRALTLLPVQNEINNAYQERNRKQEDQRRHLIITLCILAGVLVISIFIIFKQLRKLKVQNQKITGYNDTLNKHNSDLQIAQKELAETNEKLNKLNEELQTINLELREANYVKEEYVGYVFAICSHYIQKIEDLRCSINSKVKKKAWKEIEQETSSHQTLAKKELKEFHKDFDSIFLHIFPDFVNEFNSLLMPEEKIVLKEDELLNTDLRIYALVRLGITDSVKIADFLHCSPQTVYNYRFKTRNKARIPKEDFAQAVKNIGKVHIH